jgi:hypothetical protein
MRPNEPVRFECGECQIVFDLCVDPTRAREIAADLGVDAIEAGPPICCPFCGDSDLKALHDRPPV